MPNGFFFSLNIFLNKCKGVEDSHKQSRYILVFLMRVSLLWCIFIMALPAACNVLAMRGDVGVFGKLN